MITATIADRATAKLDITGMTCASCAARIEKRLNRLDGVEATVNYATEQASVHVAPGAASTNDLLDAVSAIGYSAVLVAPPDERTPSNVPAVAEQHAAEGHLAALRQRLVVSALLASPVLVLSMVPALQFDN